jgi:hypothetical protein
MSYLFNAGHDDMVVVINEAELLINEMYSGFNASMVTDNVNISHVYQVHLHDTDG